MEEEKQWILDDIDICEEVGEFEDEWVYDIEVEDETHTFIGNDILVHNSLYLTYTPIMNSCGYEGDGLEFILSLDRLFVKDYFKGWLDQYAEKYKVKNIHDFELETVNKNSLHIAKKMYLNNPLWEDGIFHDDMSAFLPKGIDIVRSSTPAFVRGKNQKGGIWEFVSYLFKEDVENLNSVDIMRIMKNLKSQFMLADIEDISFTTSLSKYDEKVIEDQSSLEVKIGSHFSIPASALHNHLLHKYPEYKSRYDMLKGGRVKWIFIKNYPLNDRIAYLRSFFPHELIEKEKIEIDYDTMFEKSMISIVNRFVEPLGLPEINKRLGVLNSLFEGMNLGDKAVESKSNSGLTSEWDDWDDEFDF